MGKSYHQPAARWPPRTGDELAASGYLRSTARAGRLLLTLAPFFCFLVAWIFTASRAPLWNDELYTLHVANQPTVGGIWRLLLTGVEQTPPGFYLLMRGSIELFGSSPLAMRIPALLGFLGLMVLIYLIVRRVLGAKAGLLAAVLPLATPAYSYSYNARSYALVLGLMAAALFCWQSYASGKWPRCSLLFLVLAVMAAVSTHYYAVLGLLPIAVGELTRSLISRRFDAWVWAALATAALPLVAFVPLIKASRGFAEVFWTIPYGDPITDPRFVGFALLGCVLAWHAVWRIRTGRVPAPPALFAPEFTAALTFLFLPLIGAIVGTLVIGAFTSRYSIAVVIGVSLLLPVAAFSFDHNRRRIAVAVLLTLTTVSFLYHIIASYASADKARKAQLADLRLLEEHGPKGGDVVVADHGNFVELSHVAPPRLKRSLVYLADPAMALRVIKTDSVDRGLLFLARFTRLNVRPYGAYISEHPRLTVLCSGCAPSPRAGGDVEVALHGRRVSLGWGNWLIPTLAETGRTPKVDAREHDSFLLNTSPHG